MATTHGTKCSWVLHPEAVKGYLECRKLLVERETEIVMMMVKSDVRVLVDESNPNGYVLTGGRAQMLDGRGEKTFAQVELETVRDEIAEIDRLIGGGKGDAKEDTLRGPIIRDGEKFEVPDNNGRLRLWQISMGAPKLIRD